MGLPCALGPSFVCPEEGLCACPRRFSRTEIFAERLNVGAGRSLLGTTFSILLPLTRPGANICILTRGLRSRILRLQCSLPRLGRVDRGVPHPTYQKASTIERGQT